MTRGTLMVAAGIVLGAVGITAARHDEKHEAVRPLAVREIAEKLDGKEAKATAVEVTFEPGQAGAPGRRSGTSWTASTSGRSMTSRPRCSRRVRRSTSRAGACTG
jgi:hypothetical protein